MMLVLHVMLVLHGGFAGEGNSSAFDNEAEFHIGPGSSFMIPSGSDSVPEVAVECSIKGRRTLVCLPKFPDRTCQACPLWRPSYAEQ